MRAVLSAAEASRHRSAHRPRPWALLCLLMVAGCQGETSEEATALDAERERSVMDAETPPGQVEADASVQEEPCVARYAEKGPSVVGVRTLIIDEQPVEVWYPAAEAGSETAHYDMREWLPAEAAAAIPDDMAPLHDTGAYTDAPPAAGLYPVVLFSHGLAGYRLQSSFLMTHLASWGFIVLAPEHPERGLAVILEAGVPEGDNAAAALRSGLVGLMDSELGTHVDSSRVAVGGHSMGTVAASQVAADDNVSAWFVLAGAGFGVGPAKPLLMMAGTNDGLARPDLVETGFAQQTGDRRLVSIAEAGHLAFTDICAIGREQGGVLQIAIDNGVEVPDFVVDLANDGCREGDLEAEIAWPIIGHYVAAHLREALNIDPELMGFDDTTMGCFGEHVAAIELAEAAPPPGEDPDAGAPPVDAGPAPDAGMSPPADAGEVPAPDAAGMVDEDPNTGMVICGEVSCDLESTICCTGLQGQACTEGESCGAFEAPAFCDGPEDCPGAEVCCVGFPAGARCMDACGGADQALCHQDADCPGSRCQVCQFPGASAQICADQCP